MADTNTYPFFRFMCATFCGAFTLLAPVAHGASITWGAPQQISGDGDVSTSGVLIGAFNVGDVGVPSTTVNGVTFQSFAAPAGNGTSGNFTLTSTGSFAHNTAAGSSSAPFTNLSTQYQTLLASRVAGVFGAMSLTMSGLIVGAQYQFQAWSNSSDTEFDFPLRLITGSTFVDLSSNTAGAEGGLGQWVIGTFTADSVTQTINFEWGEGGLFNAFQLRQFDQPAGVPEAGSTLALLGCAVTGLACLRRKLAAVASAKC